MLYTEPWFWSTTMLLQCRLETYLPPARNDFKFTYLGVTKWPSWTQLDLVFIVLNKFLLKYHISWHSLVLCFYVPIFQKHCTALTLCDVDAFCVGSHLGGEITGRKCLPFKYSISQEICTRFLLCCAFLWLYIDWWSLIHQAYFNGTVAI